jgi:hypothetical protein
MYMKTNDRVSVEVALVATLEQSQGLPYTGGAPAFQLITPSPSLLKGEWSWLTTES